MEKICRTCGESKPLSHFYRRRESLDGLDYYCKSCKYEKHRKRYTSNPFRTHITNKRSECLKKGIPFDLDEDYLKSIWTGICPISGETLELSNTLAGRNRTAQLDRIDPSKGYTYGNVAYISGRMNRIKYNATPSELRRVADWMEEQLERATTNCTPKRVETVSTFTGEDIVCSA